MPSVPTVNSQCNVKTDFGLHQRVKKVFVDWPKVSLHRASTVCKGYKEDFGVEMCRATKYSCLLALNRQFGVNNLATFCTFFPCNLFLLSLLVKCRLLLIFLNFLILLPPILKRSFLTCFFGLYLNSKVNSIK